MRALVSCVAEADDRWGEMVTLLSSSVRRFGGTMSDSIVVANFVGHVPASAERDLRALDVDLRVVERFDGRCRWANKLRMLELSELFDFDVLVALDCDMGVMGDISAFLSADRVRAQHRPRSTSRAFSDDQWRIIFEHFGLDVRKTTVGDRQEPSWPYYNSGALMIPREDCTALLKHWTASLEGVHSMFADHPEFRGRQRFSDQIALAVALQAGQFRVDPLPPNLNFTTSQYPIALEPDVPVILHYHRNLDRRGFVRRSASPTLNRYINALNEERARVLDIPYAHLSRRIFSHWMKQGPRWRKRLWNGASALRRTSHHR